MDPERSPQEQGRAADGAVLAVIAVLMALTGALFPVPMWLVAPVPLAVLAYRHGYRLSIITAVLAVVLVGYVEQQVFAGLSQVAPAAQLRFSLLGIMVVPVTLGLIGLVIGGAWREGASAGQTFALTVLAALLPGAVFWVGVRLVHGVDLLQVFMDNSLLLAKAVVEQAGETGLGPDAVGEWRAMIQDAERGFPLIRPFLPGSAVVTAGVLAAVNMTLARLLLVRAGERPAWFPPFGAWRFPWPLALGFVAGHGLLLAGAAAGMDGLAIAGENLRVMFHWLFTVQGLAIGWYWLERRLAPAWRVLILAVLFLWAPALLAWAGVLDTWFNFRRLPHPEDEGEPGGAR